MSIVNVIDGESLFFSIAFLPLLISYPVEILPYPIRAKGFTISSFTVSVALIFNQYVNPIALQNIAWRYYVRIVLSAYNDDTEILLYS